MSGLPCELADLLGYEELSREEPELELRGWCLRCGKFIGRCGCREPLAAADLAEIDAS